MKWNNIKITIFKELRGIIRDKKSLHKLIIYPLLIPLIIILFGILKKMELLQLKEQVLYLIIVIIQLNGVVMLQVFLI